MAVLARRLDLQFQLLEAPPILKPAITPRIVESGEGEAIRNLRATLEASIASKLTSGSELVRAVARQRREEILPTTIPPLDTLLGGGLARGKMTEIAGRGTRFSIVIATLAAATSIGEAAALIDASVGDTLAGQICGAVVIYDLNESGDTGSIAVLGLLLMVVTFAVLALANRVPVAVTAVEEFRG